MIMKVVVRDNTSVHEDTVDSSVTTVREELDKYNIDYFRGIAQVNGTTLTEENLDDTFDELGIVGTAFVSSIIKSNNN